jgi:hypothetical protein
MRAREKDKIVRREPEAHRERDRDTERDEEDVVFSKDSVSCMSLGFLLRLGVLLIAFVCVMFQL